MPAQKRFPTDYPGVYYIEGKGTPGSGHKIEKIYYIDYRKDGNRFQEKAGRQFKDDLTPARASLIRAAKIEGRALPNVEKRAAEKAKKEAEKNRWTIARLWDNYCKTFPANKGLRNEGNKFDLYLRNDIGKKEPRELLPLDVDRLRIRLQKKGKKTTAARILELLRRTINFGAKRGLVPPISFKIEIPKLNNQTTEDLNPEQLRKLLKALNADEDQAAANVMRLALFTGMRHSEILKLKWDIIDFERGFITLEDPKGGPDQLIPLNESVIDIFDSIERNHENPYVFPGRRKGRHLVNIYKSTKRIAEAAELPAGFRPLHGLRHVYASMLASSGEVDMYTLQKLLTHKSPAMVQRYAHLRDDVLKRAADLAGNIISNIGESDERNTEKSIRI